MSKLPLVSCLCITKNKLEILQRSINCFRAQTYQNKELIIIRQGEDEIISNFIMQLNEDNIFYIQLPFGSQQSLGDLRNISVDVCRGEYFCVWDDDDWQHMDRVKVQMMATLKSFHPASTLTNLLAFNEQTQSSFFTSFRLWEGTLLCRKDLFLTGIKYPSLSKSEDSSLLNLILHHYKVLPLVSSTLYIYVFHGYNTWHLEHFNKNVFHQPLSGKASIFIANVLGGNYSCQEASKRIDCSTIPKELNYFYRK